MASTRFLIVALVASAAGRSLNENDVQKSNADENGPYFQGDMILGERQLIQAKSGIKNVTLFGWPSARFFYDISHEYTTTERIQIMSAIQHINDETCFKILPRTRFNRDYVYIFPGSGCYSHLGRQGGQQSVSLDKNGCLVKGVIVHELLHALGIGHEHNRYDRDHYVKVLFANISPDFKAQFEKDSQKDFSTFGIGYDYHSVMHYSSTAGSGNGEPTLLPVESSGVSANEIGQRKDLSDKDVQRINKMYSC